MSKRLAFFVSKEEVENRLGISTIRDNLFEPDYNITPGKHIPVIYREDEEIIFKRLRWGPESGGNAFIRVADADKELQSGNTFRCSVLASGFFIWKGDTEKGYPFFVRLLNHSLLTMAGIVYGGHTEPTHFKIIEDESNVLVQPMSEFMPVLLNSEYVDKWLQGKGNQAAPLLREARDQIQLTDMSVLRVSKKVNDPQNNAPELIQPIPK
ncbi:SOS response-associated peptidase [Rhodohalobacter mucosus]|uniref:Abasic site processing protein n=1 Tax=Rhodohalobacter mucosus TaxID=2079485 RepID=A0A316TN50_9BACT|nr:SOS response-associated peptidase family protein [Rhodohalobacter mucosus]PWN05840.1 hypothetical protein DDZ15_11665 [Rhodohalobacter mucosus]